MLSSAFGDCAIIYVEMWPLFAPHDWGNIGFVLISLFTHPDKNVLQKRSLKSN